MFGSVFTTNYPRNDTSLLEPAVKQKMKKDWSYYRFVAFLPLLAVILLYAVESSARGAFFICNIGACNESIPEHIWSVLRADSVGNNPSLFGPEESMIRALRYGGRMIWTMVAEIYLIICIAALAVASILTFRFVPRLPILSVASVLVLSFTLGILLFANPRLHMLVFLVVFERAITPDIPAIAQITNFYNSLGNATAFSLLIAIVAILMPPQESDMQEMEQISNRMNSLRIVLYTGTILLVGTMLLKRTIFEWALAYTSQEEQAVEAGRILISNLLAMDGGFYTLVLAAAYLPATVILRRRAELTMDSAGQEAEEEAKFKQHGLALSFTESFPRILAILGPVLVGPIGELLTTVLGK